MRKTIMIGLALLGLAVNGFAADISSCKAAGTNLDSMNYFSRDRVYLDLTMAASRWQVPGNDTNAGQDIDNDRYFRSIDPAGKPPESYIHTDEWGRDADKEDTYAILYEGEGQIHIHLQKPHIVEESPGRMVVKIDPGALFLQVLNTKPENYVRNIHMVPLEFEKTYQEKPFRERYFKNWGIFPVWRFMDLMAVNGSQVTDWGSRRLKSNYGDKGGMPIEDIIALANQANVAPWLTIPHMATDDYVSNLAKYVKAHLDPKLRVYIEYTNEAWNGGFRQHRYMEDEGRKQGMDPAQFYADRATQIFKIWEQVYGGSDKIVRVLGGQLVNTWLTERMLSWKDVAAHTDALAVGHYFGFEYGSDLVEKTVTMTPEQLLEDIKTNSLPRVKADVVRQKALTDKYKISLIAYEAGQHLVGAGYNPKVGGYVPDNKQLADLFIAANRHPLMKEVYKQHYKNWVEAGGGLHEWFSSTFPPSKWGNWGFLENGGQKHETAPKYMAAKELQSELDAKSVDACRYVTAP